MAERIQRKRTKGSRLADAARRAENYAADHARAIAVLLVLAALTRPLPATVIVDVPPVLAITAFIAVIVAAAVMLILDLYRTQILAADWDTVCDQADQGARAADRHDHELEQIRIYLAARDDPDPDQTITADTVTAHPAVTRNIQTAALRPVPHKRQDTTASLGRPQS